MLHIFESFEISFEAVARTVFLEISEKEVCRQAIDLWMKETNSQNFQESREKVLS